MQSSIVAGTDAYELTQHPELLQYPTGVSALEKEAGLMVSPNPATGPVRISFTDAKGLQDIRVTNVTGQTIARVPADAGITNYNIDMSAFSKGLYLIQCNFAAGTVTRKIIVQ